MRYPVDIEKDGKFLMVTFPDIPEANSQGETLEEALEMAKDALESALEFYFEDGRKIPAPSDPKPGQHMIEVSPGIMGL